MNPALSWKNISLARKFHQVTGVIAFLLVVEVVAVFFAVREPSFTLLVCLLAFLIAEGLGLTLVFKISQAMQRSYFELETRVRERTDALEFIDESSNMLSSSLDYESTLTALSEMLVPRYADWCSVEILDEGKIKSVAIAHVDPEKLKLARQMQERWPTNPEAPTGTPNVLRTGASELYSEVPEKLLVLGAKDEEHLRMGQALRLRSALVVPLVARHCVLGALTMIWSESNRRYDASDVAPMEELGRRAGMAVDNARMYREAQQAIRVREDFLAIAGHELKTPLAALLLTVQGAARIARNDPTTGVSERLERAARSGFRLERLINQLLDVSKITAGRLSLEQETFDLSVLVGEVVSRFVDENATARERISLHNGQKLEGSWDLLRIDQVISNLVGNALKYGQGKPIQVAVSADQDLAVLSVVDHGIGIPLEKQRKIFERFERAVANRDFDGIGLGLWITRQIVEASGGTIEVDSEPERGTTFTVRLPMRPAERHHVFG